MRISVIIPSYNRIHTLTRAIDSVLNQDSKVDEIIVVITEDICLNNNFYIGLLPDIGTDVINYLRVNKSAAIDELKGYTKLSKDKLDEIMKELLSLRLIREKGNEHYLSV